MSHLRLAAKLSSGLLALAVAGCTPAAVDRGSAIAATPVPPPAQPPAGASLAEFFQKYEDAQLSLSPETKTRRGVRDGDYGKWDDQSDEAEVARHKLQQASAAAMRGSFNPAALSTDDALSFELFNSQADRAERLFAFRDHAYLFDQMNGAQSDMPAFLINMHRVADEAEAEAYVSRITGMGPTIAQLGAEAERRAGAGMGRPNGSMPMSCLTSTI